MSCSATWRNHYKYADFSLSYTISRLFTLFLGLPNASEKIFILSKKCLGTLTIVKCHSETSQSLLFSRRKTFLSGIWLRDWLTMNFWILRWCTYHRNHVWLWSQIATTEIATEKLHNKKCLHDQINYISRFKTIYFNCRVAVKCCCLPVIPEVWAENIKNFYRRQRYCPGHVIQCVGGHILWQHNDVVQLPVSVWGHFV